jgi:hypothetical protein
MTSVKVCGVCRQLSGFAVNLAVIYSQARNDNGSLKDDMDSSDIRGFRLTENPPVAGVCYDCGAAVPRLKTKVQLAPWEQERWQGHGPAPKFREHHRYCDDCEIRRATESEKLFRGRRQRAWRES